jgi:4-amino-4-deoxy-L-arabinose transferase-like glycosyltransferase
MKKIFKNKKMDKNKVAILIFFLALTVRIIFIFSIHHGPLENDAEEYNRLAIFLSQGKGYVNVDGEPTAYRPPIYPLFLGIIYFVAGYDLLWVRLIQAVIGAGICIFVYFIATKVLDKRAAILTGIFCSLYPPLIVNVSEIMTETLFTFLLVLAIWLIISSKSMLNLLLCGLVFGLALLTRSFIIFFFPFLLYWLLMHDKNKSKKGIVLLFLGILLVLSPWTIRNYLQFNRFVPLSNIGGLTLYNSYMVPEKGFGYNSLESLSDEYFEIDNETDKNKFLVRKSIEYIRKNPWEVIQLTAIKTLLFIYPFDGYWYPIPFGSKYNIFWGLVLCFSAIGIVLHFNDKNVAKKIIDFLLISFLIGIIIFYGSPRFRFPIDPLLIIFAASALTYIAKEKFKIFFMIISINVTFFFVFRYFNFQAIFDFLKSNI